jgi:HlyD family secretion protein
MYKTITIVCLVALLIGGYVLGSHWLQTSAASAEPTPAAAPDDTYVHASARVVPVQYAELGFAVGGTVAEVAVREGQQVEAGAVLARLDDTAQRARVTARRSELAQSQANYAQVRRGARPEELRAAEAALAQAQAQLRQTLSSVSPADLAAAEAQIRQAQSQLARLKSGPNPNDMRAAEAALSQAQHQLTTQRDSLSASKTTAQIALEQASIKLQQAQTNFSTARWNWEHVQENGTDPLTPKVTDATGKSRNNTLNEAQKQQYYDAYVQAELSMRSAERAVQEAQVAYDNARQAEASGIQTSEQAVAQAQAQLDRTRGAITSDQLAGAQAQLASAQAQQGRLRGDQRESTLAAAKAGVAVAEANLALLEAGPDQSALAVAQAQVTNAQAQLDLEQVLLDQYVLRAPFGGVVAAIDLRLASQLPAGAVVVRIADTSTWQIETNDLTELQIANLTVDTPASVTVDALPGETFAGKISSIRPFGEQKQGDIVYTVTVTLKQQDRRLRWNMTAAVAIAPLSEGLK